MYEDICGIHFSGEVLNPLRLCCYRCVAFICLFFVWFDLLLFLFIIEICSYNLLQISSVPVILDNCAANSMEKRLFYSLHFLATFHGLSEMKVFSINMYCSISSPILNKLDLNFTLLPTIAINLTCSAFWGYCFLFSRWYRTKVELGTLHYTQFRT